MSNMAKKSGWSSTGWMAAQAEQANAAAEGSAAPHCQHPECAAAADACALTPRGVAKEVAPAESAPGAAGGAGGADGAWAASLARLCAAAGRRKRCSREANCLLPTSCILSRFRGACEAWRELLEGGLALIGHPPICRITPAAPGI